VIGHVKPSGTIDINGLMVIDASTFMRSGVHVQNIMHTSTGLSGKIIIQGNRLVSVQMDAPEEATNTFSFDSRLFLLQESGPKAVQLDQKPRINTKSCSPTWFSQTFGAELCGELDFYPKTENGPRGLLTGPKHAALFLRKVRDIIQFEYSKINLILFSLTYRRTNTAAITSSTNVKAAGPSALLWTLPIPLLIAAYQLK
jgi:hypothetical protein